MANGREPQTGAEPRAGLRSSGAGRSRSLH